MLGKDIKYKICLRSPDDIPLGDFTCGKEKIDKIIRNNALANCVTYLVKNQPGDKIIAYCSLSCSGIHQQIGNIIQVYSAIEIKCFAVLDKLHKLPYDNDDEHFYFSDKILCEMVNICRDISENQVGAGCIVLYSVPEALNFYQRNNFKSFDEYALKFRENIRFLDGCTPLFLDL